MPAISARSSLYVGMFLCTSFDHYAFRTNILFRQNSCTCDAAFVLQELLDLTILASPGVTAQSQRMNLLVVLDQLLDLFSARCNTDTDIGLLVSSAGAVNNPSTVLHPKVNLVDNVSYNVLGDLLCVTL